MNTFRTTYAHIFIASVLLAIVITIGSTQLPLPWESMHGAVGSTRVGVEIRGKQTSQNQSMQTNPSERKAFQNFDAILLKLIAKLSNR